ncbi:hypothetical protein VSS37_16750 [Candidatus Thiothrix sp. Deng01]|uniref:Secreted protein n=1 Tax=Candidatus Thiothrix phosphatis TaxID=3112415 RepID=A0ABU6D0M7_9GAMM|nr:hypothetical protein [Candidatus Thiothrix sp. Deng01]MEB4592635.1 hypothetical protein [Candidatus Thiothrix sp. Deng01]
MELFWFRLLALKLLPLLEINPYCQLEALGEVLLVVVSEPAVGVVVVVDAATTVGLEVTVVVDAAATVGLEDVAVGATDAVVIVGAASAAAAVLVGRTAFAASCWLQPVTSVVIIEKIANTAVCRAFACELMCIIKNPRDHRWINYADL